MSDALKNYMTPPYVTDSYWLELDDAAVKFRVQLPSARNRQFVIRSAELMFESADDGAVNPVLAVESQKQTFAARCILECDDSSVVIATLWNEYPAVIAELWDKATTAIELEEAKLIAIKKKLKIT